MSTFLKPLIVSHIHVQSCDDRKTLCSLCAQALHMHKGELKLLLYYADQQNGFRPSAQHAADSVSISRRNIFYLRNLLVQHGIAKIQDGRFYIDWERIRLFSTLDPELTGKDPFIKPLVIKREHKVYRMTNDLYEFLVYGEQEKVCAYFDGLSERDYKLCCFNLKKWMQREKLHYNSPSIYFKFIHEQEEVA